MAVVFSVTGVLGVLMTIAAFRSRQYRQLSAAYRTSGQSGPQPEGA